MCCPKAVYNHSTGLVDWTGGHTQTVIKMLQCRAEAYSAYMYHFTKVAPLACSHQVSRGQRSHAYLISFNDKLQVYLLDDIRIFLFSMLQQRLEIDFCSKYQKYVHDL